MITIGKSVNVRTAMIIGVFIEYCPWNSQIPAAGYDSGQTVSVRIIKVTTTEERVLYQLRSLKKCIPRHMREANMRRKER